ncbi:MAG: DUF1904 family protein [Sarcina sp.]
MPMIKFRGIEKSEVKAKSRKLVDDLARVVECPRDYFTLEISAGEFVFDGEDVEQPSIIQVSCFDRGQAIQNEVAQIITSAFKGDKEYLEVFFTKLEENSYYENGEHF